MLQSQTRRLGSLRTRNPYPKEDYGCIPDCNGCHDAWSDRVGGGRKQIRQCHQVSCVCDDPRGCDSSRLEEVKLALVDHRFSLEYHQ